jgi:hypothetical protein
MGKKNTPDSKAGLPDDTLDESTTPVGGFAFFLSLLLLLPSSIVLLALALARLGSQSVGPLLLLVVGAVIGGLITHLFLRKHLSVLLHEWKHSVVSNLVGNKRKRMRIDEHSGFFEYSYTKETAHFNFLIALAPYIIPVFTLVAALTIFAVQPDAHWKSVALLGVGYGADVLMNLRDISPIQTDISLIRGGYWFGVSYIAAWNVTILALVIAWCAAGGSGLSLLLQDLSSLFFAVHPITRELIR